MIYLALVHYSLTGIDLSFSRGVKFVTENALTFFNLSYYNCSYNNLTGMRTCRAVNMHAAKASFKRWPALKLSMPPVRIIPCVTVHGLVLCMHTDDAVLVAEGSGP